MPVVGIKVKRTIASKSFRTNIKGFGAKDLPPSPQQKEEINWEMVALMGAEFVFRKFTKLVQNCRERRY